MLFCCYFLAPASRCSASACSKSISKYSASRCWIGIPAGWRIEASKTIDRFRQPPLPGIFYFLRAQVAEGRDSGLRVSARSVAILARRSFCSYVDSENVIHYTSRMAQAANPKNAALVTELRAKAAKLSDAKLKSKAVRVAQIVERSEDETPLSLRDMVFRHLTSGEKRRGVELEALANQPLAKHRRAVA